MLDPDYLDQAADMVGAVYGEVEAKMLAYLCRLLLDEGTEELGQRGLTALNLLAQTHAADLAAILAAHREDMDRAVAEVVEDAVSRSDRADLSRLGDEAREAAAATRPRQVALTTQGVAAILERDNVEMVQGALDLWNRCVAEAVTRVNAGADTAERAIHRAVREMSRQGISTIQYRDSETGRRTVRNRVDVAVRRHVRTQIAQDGMRRTEQICRDAGVRLVEVSSHGGARPSHARWQGRVYSLDGDVTIDGVRYEDFYRETGYGDVAGLGGANCRHSFGPWVPGAPRMYKPDPPHPSGLDGDEIYRLSQGQRRRERDIRQTKRELAAAQLVADSDASLANVAEVERLKDRLRRQQAGMRAYIEGANSRGKAPVLRRSPNREWAGDMPRIRKSDASRRTMREFLDGDGVGRSLRSHGVSKGNAQRALSAEMRGRGMEPRDFPMLSRTNQQDLLKSILPGMTPTKEGRRQFRRISGDHSAVQDLAAVNQSFKTGDVRWTHNCQRSVPAYEMRRRGYDVVAKPREVDENGEASKSDHLTENWDKVFEGAEFLSCSGDGKDDCDRLMRDWEDGARAEVYVAWEGGGAHVFVAENHEGEIIYRDPQSGKEDASSHFQYVIDGFTMIARIDNLEPSELIDECCTSRKR